MAFHHAVGGSRYRFDDLRSLLAKASPPRSGDVLAGLAAASEEERVAARFALADLPLRHLLAEAVVPYEIDEITRLIIDRHEGRQVFYRAAHSEIVDLLRSAEHLLTATGESIELCPNY